MKKRNKVKLTANKKRKSKKLPYTPNGVIVHALRKLWLRSRERAATLRRDGYACQRCQRKQSKAKGREFEVTVHHLEGIDWSGIADLIRSRILQTPEKLLTLCQDCHEKEHSADDWMS